MKSAKYLDDLKIAKGLATDKDLAEALGVTKAAISQYRSGTRMMDNEMCLNIALQLGIDPMRIIMTADIDRAERAGQHSLWEVFSRKTTATAASVVLFGVVNLFLTPTPSQAAPMLEKHVDYSLYYVK
jgi:transcriptional regulator with XRE-family HTH domain